MTFGTILADLYQRLGYASSPAAEVTTRLKSFVNQAHRQVLGDSKYMALRDSTMTFASVSGQVSYGLPPIIAQIKSITDRTSVRRLIAISQDDVRAMDPALNSTGVSSHYVYEGVQAVALQPSAASEIFVKSSSASDTNTAYIEAVRTGGYPVSLSVVMTGTTAVSLGAAYTDIIEVTKFYLSANAVGTVTLHQTSGVGTELARIPIGQSFARYLSISLWPTPTSALTYHIDYVRVVPDLVNTNDQPMLPEDFHWMLVEGALVIEWTQKDDARRIDAERAWTKAKSQLAYRVNCPPDYLPVLGGRDMEFQRLGGQYSDGAGVR